MVLVLKEFTFFFFLKLKFWTFIGAFILHASQIARFDLSLVTRANYFFPPEKMVILGNLQTSMPF